MEIILRETIENLGNAGQGVKVASGYARNYLLPHKLVLPASPSNMKQLEQIKQHHEVRAERARADAEGQARDIEGLTFALIRQASEEGRLYGSVSVQDLVLFLGQHGLSVEKRRIALDEPIKALGDYTVPIRLHPEVTADLKVTVARR